MVGNPDYDPNICPNGTIDNYGGREGYGGIVRDDYAFRGISIPIPDSRITKPDYDPNKAHSDKGIITYSKS